MSDTKLQYSSKREKDIEVATACNWMVIQDHLLTINCGATVLKSKLTAVKGNW